MPSARSDSNWTENGAVIPLSKVDTMAVYVPATDQPTAFRAHR